MMLVAVAVALVLGLLIGGRPENLSQTRFRWGTFLFVAVVVRYGTEATIRYGVQPVEALRFPLYVVAFAAIAAILWANRAQPGLLLAAAGVTSNGLAVVLNGGWMPVWRPALESVGMTPADLAVSFHRLLPEQLGSSSSCSAAGPSATCSRCRCRCSPTSPASATRSWLRVWPGTCSRPSSPHPRRRSPR